eukprot:TRINITY_DN7609_c0_g1_i1.p1 TRINITY_DN7609_c0_g1~~TRINITY_DN7609_c0_g1_i1.p1  ORF type:complete len:176 (+),score=38.59 TRINITY_DN7609_c0_g1_i1:57-584(+)
MYKRAACLRPVILCANPRLNYFSVRTISYTYGSPLPGYDRTRPDRTRREPIPAKEPFNKIGYEDEAGKSLNFTTKYYTYNKEIGSSSNYSTQAAGKTTDTIKEKVDRVGETVKRNVDAAADKYQKTAKATEETKKSAEKTAENMTNSVREGAQKVKDSVSEAAKKASDVIKSGFT